MNNRVLVNHGYEVYCAKEDIHNNQVPVNHWCVVHKSIEDNLNNQVPVNHWCVAHKTVEDNLNNQVFANHPNLFAHKLYTLFLSSDSMRHYGNKIKIKIFINLLPLEFVQMIHPPDYLCKWFIYLIICANGSSTRLLVYGNVIMIHCWGWKDGESPTSSKKLKSNSSDFLISSH